MLLSSWEQKRLQKIFFQEASLALGVSVSDLDSPEHEKRFFQFNAERFSSELLRNRLSDACGWIQLLWNGLGSLTQLGILVAVIWNTATRDLSYSVHAWWMVAVALVFIFFSVLFSLACKVLTGRYPGEARRGRKMLAELIAQ